MIRKHENSDSWKAGFFAIAVHAVLLGALLISFNWKSAHPVQNVAEVELWDSLPSSAPRVVEQKIEPKHEPKVEPPPEVKEEPKPEPKVEEPKVDIALEQKKAEEKTKKLEEEKQKKEKADALKKLQATLNETEPDITKKEKKAKDDALKKLQQEALSEESASGDEQARSAKAAASKGVIDEYKRKIQDKIKGNVNKSLCSDGNPEPVFEISLLPTGELSGKPKLAKSSGNEACDEAVERAIIASEPLPMPSDASLFSQFRNLRLKFKPNSE